jgi:pimeloyl-ACP methyl ester carboxylesterase
VKAQKKRRSIGGRWLWIIGGLFLVFGLWHLISHFYLEEEKELRSQIRQRVKEKFPEKTAEFAANFGLFPYGSEEELPGWVDTSKKTVVLIHGLDDPGKIWQNLAPELAREGFYVWLMHYPNDQPIAESSRFLFGELKGLRQLGVRRLSMAAHSMGGLVAREMLTSPDIRYSRSVKNGEVPQVTALIMVGTPNHGSHLARFRAFGELRDQLGWLVKGDAQWLGSILDGAGEAKIDLLPGSRFLTELNARPHPEGIYKLIIAGITSPWNEGDISRWLDSLRPKVPDDRQGKIDRFGRYLASMTNGLGDGLVTVESTRLEGIPHQTVRGTHLSMIRNITEKSQRIPPAVPIIVDQLKKE